ncbi:unnamed protein product [Rotaria magnacalcarata]|uniref:G-protein coupled receptors family 1 profile domain-containing protein n=1 Tax=Rotaria magnacalcarata TaxID=392030 RepID=A0A819XT76_9BILA|nr:unnamed protein product [Rotaria magnacalcarata]CAF2119949.1 unnamed protein product [Rotaria magnacalcarata]CAF4147749.1 unnamed protein product [Rotaria magnacalcarata]CAF4301965.1 unnamed protein product [Rotaria magnacalcarata]
MTDLEEISRKLMIVAGILMILFGLTGNVLNTLIFTDWSRSRGKANGQRKKSEIGSSPLYLLTSSIASFIVIAYGLCTRILFDGYNYPVTPNNMLFLCKLRYFCLHTFDTISWICLCMGILDRYLITSREVRLRQLSKTRRQTKLIILFVAFFVGLHSIPLAVYYDVSQLGQCIIYSTFYLYYYRYIFQIMLHGIIPIISFSIFGFLTYKQLQILKNRQNIMKNVNADKQLSRMFLLTSFTIVLSAIPYSAESTYYLIFADSSQQQISYVFFFHILSSILFYTNPVCSFYVYYISTPNFRIQALKIILCKKNVNGFMNNQVNTITTAN